MSSTLTRIAHVAIDFTLLAGFLAGIKKNTGIQPDVTVINQPDVERWAQSYLNFGDTIYNKSVDWMGQSKYFVRKNN